MGGPGGYMKGGEAGDGYDTLNPSGAPTNPTGPQTITNPTTTYNPGNPYTTPNYSLTPQSGYTGLAQQLQQAFNLRPSPYAAPRTGLQDMYASPWAALYGGPPQQTFAQMYGQDPMQGRALPPGVYQPGSTPPPVNTGPGVPANRPPIVNTPPPGGGGAPSTPPIGGAPGAGNKSYQDDQLAASIAAGHVPGQGHRSVPGWLGPEQSQGRWKPGGSLYGLLQQQQAQFGPPPPTRK